MKNWKNILILLLAAVLILAGANYVKNYVGQQRKAKIGALITQYLAAKRGNSPNQQELRDQIFLSIGKKGAGSSAAAGFGLQPDAEDYCFIKMENVTKTLLEQGVKLDGSEWEDLQASIVMRCLGYLPAEWDQ